MKNKLIVSSATVCAVGLLSSNIYAVEQTNNIKNNIIRICLEGLGQKERLSTEFFNYFKNQEQDFEDKMIMYENFVDTIKTNDTTYIYEINNGSIFYEEILFSHPKVKSIMNDLKAEYNTTSTTTLKDLTKKELLARPNSLESLLKESLSKGYANKKAIFKSIFKREPNSKEVSWMSNIDTLKIAAYSGEINKRFANTNGYGSFIELTTEQINKINSNKGYEILVSKDAKEEEIYNAFHEYDAAYSIIQTLESFAIYEISFNNNYRVFKEINELMISYFNIDIFNVLTQSELEEIHNKSILDLRFDKIKALENTLSKLVNKGLIENNNKVETPTLPEEDENSNNFVQDNHPFVERYDFYKNDKSWKDTFNKLSQDIWKFFSGSNFFNISNGSQRIYFSYKGEEYDTQIGIDKDMLSNEMASVLLEKISKELNIKTINSLKKTMILFDNSINIIPYLEFTKEKENLSKIKESYKNLGISIYTKKQENKK